MRVDELTAHGAVVTNVNQPRLVSAAHEFEAQLMKEILKPLAAKDALFSDQGDTDECGILGEFGAEALGRALSEHGGLGLGSSIVRSLSHSGTHPESNRLARLDEYRRINH